MSRTPWDGARVDPVSQERTVRHLQELYTVAVSVALGAGIVRLVGVGPQEPTIQWDSLPMLVALLATLIPFYHGSMRHLDQVYVEEGGGNVRANALLMDFLLLFIETGVLFVIAGLLPKPWYAGWAIVILLVFDSLWGSAVHFAFSRPGRPIRPLTALRWAVLNLAFAPAFAALLLLGRPSPAEGPLSLPIALGFMVVAVLRSALDYTISWTFYFPREEAPDE